MKRGQSDRILPLAPVGQHRQCGIPQNWLPRLVLAGIGIAVSDRATRRPGFGFGTASPGRGLGSDRAWQKAKALIEDQKAAGADSKMTNAGISSTAPPTRRPSPVASLTRFSDISVRAKSDSVRTRLVEFVQKVDHQVGDCSQAHVQGPIARASFSGSAPRQNRPGPLHQRMPPAEIWRSYPPSSCSTKLVGLEIERFVPIGQVDARYLDKSY